MTWTERSTIIDDTNEVRITLFDGVPDSGVAGTITCSWGATTQENMACQIIKWDEGDASAIRGHNRSGNGGQAVRPAFSGRAMAPYMTRPSVASMQRSRFVQLCREQEWGGLAGTRNPTVARHGTAMSGRR